MCQCLLFLLCLIFPPLAVLISDGCTVHFLINIFFTILGWIPGVIHAIYICFYHLRSR